MESEADKHHVYLHITDNGSGISPDQIDDTFHPFFTTKSAHNGTGLGLSVSLGIAESHGGTLTVTSDIGKESTFTLALPIWKRM
ncbi:sensor histidine kinase [Domibacillus tundrae]|uniref:sensor histidine kinase n=1 Tax=Domibacillus tundrae TaxID=1587527 RepID=UPI000617C235|nr:ATP-binding protein [Domibacillus tundrae]